MVIPSVALVEAAVVAVDAVVIDIVAVVVLSGLSRLSLNASLAIFSEYLAFILLQNTSKISGH